MRKLSEKFMSDLKEGVLKPILDMVKKDDSLCLEIRENAINVYYRGGNILKVTESDSKYTYDFDENYAIENNGMWTKFNLEKEKLNPSYFIKNLPFMKREMDNFLIAHPKDEREFQQVIIRENNSTKLAGDTDYYIADIESSKNDSRFDMIAIHWDSTPNDRKCAKNISLGIIEVKYGDASLENGSGIKDHIKKLNCTFNEEFKSHLSDEAESQFSQKRELGLVRNTEKYRDAIINRNAKIEYILICANHKPASTILKRELKQTKKEYSDFFEKVDVKIARSSLMGYGLYDSEFITVDQFLSE